MSLLKLLKCSYCNDDTHLINVCGCTSHIGCSLRMILICHECKKCKFQFGWKFWIIGILFYLMTMVFGISVSAVCIATFLVTFIILNTFLLFTILSIICIIPTGIVGFATMLRYYTGFQMIIII